MRVASRKACVLSCGGVGFDCLGMRGLCSRDADDFNDLEVISRTKNLIS
jgi:hypothetical protein